MLVPVTGRSGYWGGRLPGGPVTGLSSSRLDTVHRVREPACGLSCGALRTAATDAMKIVTLCENHRYAV
jgi:hypothetical protein